MAVATTVFLFSFCCIEDDERGPAVDVAVVTSNAHLGGAVALMASVVRHASRPVRFHLVTDNATQYHVHAWMHHPRLSGFAYEVVTFPQAGLVAPDIATTLQVSRRQRIPFRASVRFFFCYFKWPHNARRHLSRRVTELILMGLCRFYVY